MAAPAHQVTKVTIVKQISMSVLLTLAKTAAFAMMRSEDIDAIAPLHTVEQNAKQKKI